MVGIGNFIFITLCKLANAFADKQCKVSKESQTSFYSHFCSFQESNQGGSGTWFYWHALQNSRGLTIGGLNEALFMMTKKIVSTNQSPYEQEKGYLKTFIINANCQPAGDTGSNDLYPSHICFYRWRIIYSTCWKGWILKIHSLFLFYKTQKEEQKEWQLLISLSVTKCDL